MTVHETINQPRLPRLVAYDRTFQAWWVLNDGPATLDGVTARVADLRRSMGYLGGYTSVEIGADLEILREAGFVALDGGGVWSQVRLAPGDPAPGTPIPVPDFPTAPCVVCGGRGCVGPYDVRCTACASDSPAHPAYRQLLTEFVALYGNPEGKPLHLVERGLFGVWFRACKALGIPVREEMS